MRAQGDNGGISAIQIAVRDDGAEAVVPNQAISMSTNGMATVGFSSESYVNYTVKTKAALSDATWTTVTNTLCNPYYTPYTSVTLPTGSDHVFYKVEGN
jgi:hypothetical protein